MAGFIPLEEYDRILRISTEVREDYERRYEVGCGLAGFCQPVSAVISTVLESHGIKHDLIFGHFLQPYGPGDIEARGHAWIQFPQYGDAILDATATQFGDYPAVWFPADPARYQVRTRLPISERAKMWPAGPLRRPVRAHRRSR